ncbi:hypothetical protein SAMN04515692_1024 [Leifsonia sp. CL147]|nr:hypothetical protein SAMN04515694_1024 [Leifsonia sp. CL154]SFL27224.1 hypothetical protein SAMN04515692_1024 [Leifsonia sp. CL147]
MPANLVMFDLDATTIFENSGLSPGTDDYPQHSPDSLGRKTRSDERHVTEHKHHE